MAERRMFSKKIISSARFLRMPVSARELYFQLGMNADDDGIVEAFTVMRQVAANEDDLKLLEAKGFVKVLNDDLVTYIIEWLENNRLRADRKTDSKYRDLLVQVLPDVKLLGSKTRADVTPKKTNNSVHEGSNPPSTGRPMDGQVTDSSQANDGTLPENGPHRLGKGSVGKDRLGEVSKGSGGLDGLNQDKSTREYLAAWKTNPKTDPMISQLALYRQQIGEPLLSHSIQYLIDRDVTLAGVPKYLAKTVDCWLKNGITTPEGAKKFEDNRRRGPETTNDSGVPDVPIFKLTN